MRKYIVLLLCLTLGITLWSAEVRELVFTEFVDADSLAVGNACGLYTAGALYKSDADAGIPTTGFVHYTDGTTAKMVVNGIIEDALTVGSADIVINDSLFMSTTAGKITRTPPYVPGVGRLIQRVGRAISVEAGGKVDIIVEIGKAREAL